MAECLQMSNGDGRCNYYDQSEETDTKNFAMDEQGYCWAYGDPCPGDSCDSFQTQWGSDYCQRTGELVWECDCSDCLDAYCSECGEEIDNCSCEDEEDE